MDKGTIFSGQPVEKRGFYETLRNGLDHDKQFLSDTYGHRAQSEKKVRKKRILPWRKLQSQRETDIDDHRQMELFPT